MMLGILEVHGDSVETQRSSNDDIALLVKTLPFDVAEVNIAFQFVDFCEHIVTFAYKVNIQVTMRSTRLSHISFWSH